MMNVLRKIKDREVGFLKSGNIYSTFYLRLQTLIFANLLLWCHYVTPFYYFFLCFWSWLLICCWYLNDFIPSACHIKVNSQDGICFTESMSSILNWKWGIFRIFWNSDPFGHLSMLRPNQQLCVPKVYYSYR